MIEKVFEVDHEGNIDLLLDISLYLYNSPQEQITSKSKDLDGILYHFYLINRRLLWIYYMKIKILTDGVQQLSESLKNQIIDYSNTIQNISNKLLPLFHQFNKLFQKNDSPILIEIKNISAILNYIYLQLHSLKSDRFEDCYIKILNLSCAFCDYYLTYQLPSKMDQIESIIESSKICIKYSTLADIIDCGNKDIIFDCRCRSFLWGIYRSSITSNFFYSLFNQKNNV